MARLGKTSLWSEMVEEGEKYGQLATECQERVKRIIKLEQVEKQETERTWGLRRECWEELMNQR